MIIMTIMIIISDNDSNYNDDKNNNNNDKNNDKNNEGIQHLSIYTGISMTPPPSAACMRQ